MEGKRSADKPVLVVSLSLLLVLVLLVAFFVTSQPSQDQDVIVLPSPQTETMVGSAPQQQDQDDFVQVTTDNVVTVLESLQELSYYNQCYEVTVGLDEVRTTREVELWVSGSVIHAEIRDGQKVKSVLTDGKQAWLWYDVDPNPVCVTLGNGVMAEDLLGLPGFDYLLTLRQTPVVDADYLVLDDSHTQCIYVCAQPNETESLRYWINLENGLLYRTDALEQSRLIYEVNQSYYALLAEGDESFTGKFVLPDGSEPFTAERERPLS